MQKGIVVFIFANYLDDALVWNYTMSGFKRGIEKAGMGSVPACVFSCFKLPEIQAFA
jgi:hypothetical protein